MSVIIQIMLLAVGLLGASTAFVVALLNDHHNRTQEILDAITKISCLQ